MNRILVIGLGGIGSMLVEPLARYLNTQGDRKQLVLVDGDTYSRENYDRQRIAASAVRRNKAEAQALVLGPLFPVISIAAKPEFVSRKNVGDLLVEDDVVFLCVDNHATRKIVSDQARRLRDILLISAGNEYTDGNVQVYWKQSGRQKTAPLDKFHEEIKYPQDTNPADLSCEELAAEPGGVQVIFTNLTAAALALNAFYAATMSRLNYGEVYFDILANKANPVERR